MSKHTPGPWEIEPREVFGRGDRPGSAEIVVWDEDGEGSMIIVRDLDFDDAESQANARLIAQAPTMLQDLTDAAAQLRELGGEVNAALAARLEATIAAAVGGAE